MYENQSEYPLANLGGFVNKTIEGFGDDGIGHRMKIRECRIGVIGNDVYVGISKPDDKRYHGMSFKTGIDLAADEETRKKQWLTVLCGILDYDSGVKIDPVSIALHNMDLIDYVLLQIPALRPRQKDN